MDGDSGEPERTPETSSSTASFLAPGFERELAIRFEAAHERALRDADVLATDPPASELLGALTTSVDGLLEMRWAPRSPEVLAAALRMMAQQQARLDAAFLSALQAVGERDDVVPGAKAGRA